MRKLKVKTERSIILISTFIIIYTRFHQIKYKRCKKYLRNYKSKFVFNTEVKKEYMKKGKDKQNKVKCQNQRNSADRPLPVS